MLSGDDLRKQLTAAEAYNRFMEKRVRMLELENRMLQAAAYRNGPQSQSGATNHTANNASSPSDPAMMTAAQVLDELLRLRSEYKSSQSDVKQLKKELAIATANLEHYTAKEAQQRNKATQLAEEVRQLKSLLPLHLFDVSAPSSQRAGSSSAASAADEQAHVNVTGGLTPRAAPPSIPRSSASQPQGLSAAVSHPMTSQLNPPAFLTAQTTTDTSKQEWDTTCSQAIVALEAEVEQASIAIYAMPSVAFEQLPFASWSAAMPSSSASASTIMAAVSGLGALVTTDTANSASGSGGAAVVPLSPSDRVVLWRRLSARVHTIMKFSNRDLVDLSTISQTAPPSWLSSISSVVESSKSGKDLLGTSSPSSKRMVDRTQLQAESLLTLLTEHAIELVRLVIVELPKFMTTYLTRCRTAVGLIVEGQRATASPSALSSVQSQAVSLIAELRGARAGFQHAMLRLRQALASLGMVLMTCSDAVIGISTYRGTSGLAGQATVLESHVAAIMSLDAVLESDLARATSLSGIPVESAKDTTTATVEAADTKSSVAWYETGVELEAEIRRLADIDPRSGRIEKLDITRIKRLFPDSLATAASMASSGGLTHIATQSLVSLEALKSAANNTLRLLRGQTVASTTVGIASTTNNSGDTAADHAASTHIHRGIQCNLQQQKLQMTDNEMHIARLASIRGNWFEAAAASPKRGVGPAESENGSPSGQDRESSPPAPRTPRGSTLRPTAASPAEVDRLVDDYVRRLPQLVLPPNFGPIPSEARKSQRLKASSPPEGYPYAFGRRTVYITVTGAGSKLAVHVGGGYVTFEEFCLKYGPGEAVMMERKGGSPSLHHNVHIDADAALESAGSHRAPTAALRHAVRNTMRTTTFASPD